MKSTLKLTILLVCTGLMLGACGQPGALYLPEERATKVEKPEPDSTEKDRKKEPSTSTTPPTKNP